MRAVKLVAHGAEEERLRFEQPALLRANGAHEVERDRQVGTDFQNGCEFFFGFGKAIVADVGRHLLEQLNGVTLLSERS